MAGKRREKDPHIYYMLLDYIIIVGRFQAYLIT